jgi:streptogramin lyase
MAAVAVTLLLFTPAIPALASAPQPARPSPSAASSDPPVATFSVPQTGAYPVGVVTDRRGDVWFAEDNTDALVEFIPANSTFRSFPIPTPQHLAWIWYMVFDGTGKLWFADESQQLIWSFNPTTRTFANYSAGTASPMVLSYDPARNRLWFTSLTTSQVGYFDLAGGEAVLAKVANITAPVPGAGVSGLAVDPAGDVFVAESFQAKIVELNGTTLSVMRTWNLPTGSGPVGLALDEARGVLWFTDHATSFFGYVDLNSTAYRLYPTSLVFTGGDYAVSLPYWIDISSTGYLWFNEHVGDRIARFDPAKQQLTEFDIPTKESSPLMLALDDQDGEVWFTEFAGNALGMVRQNSSLGASVNVSVGSASADPSVSFTATPSTQSGSPPTLSITAGSTGEPQPYFGVTTSAEGGSYRIGLSAEEAKPGDYTASVCFDYAYVNECGSLGVVVPPQTSVLPVLYSVYLAAGVGFAALVLVVVMEMRRERARPRRP